MLIAEGTIIIRPLVRAAEELAELQIQKHIGGVSSRTLLEDLSSPMERSQEYSPVVVVLEILFRPLVEELRIRLMNVKYCCQNYSSACRFLGRI